MAAALPPEAHGFASDADADGVRERLVSTRRCGWKIGVVTNAEAVVQAATAERIGLLPFVDAFVVSPGAGIRKPDPRIFELAAARC
jgi:putative hydrolase of the HAD superfamily